LQASPSPADAPAARPTHTHAASPTDIGPDTPAAATPHSWPVLGWRIAALAAVASVLVALIPVRPPWGLLIVYGAVLAIGIVDCVLAVQPVTIGVVRKLPASLALGETSTVEWAVTNNGGRTVRVAIADDLAPSLHAASRRAQMRVAANATSIASVPIHPTRRGDFLPTDLAVRTYGPLFLAGRQATRRLEGRLRVVPSFRSKREAELRMDKARILEVGLRSARFRGSGTEFEQLRDYTTDDEFRRIDWAATARAGRAIVRTFRAERNQVVLLLLDNGRLMAGKVDGVPRVEHAMDAVMTVTAVATRLGDRVGLVAFDRTVRDVVLPSNNAGQLRRVVNAVYTLEPELAESDYRRAFLETLTRFRRRALLVLLTELADQAMQEVLFGSLPLILRNHLVVIGAVTDPQVHEWANSSPTEAGTTYQKAAAISALAQRERLAAQLTSMGASVIDAPPGRFAAQLADHYLSVKATGRL
jgi:uncharacterized protein (DUF58 family)